MPRSNSWLAGRLPKRGVRPINAGSIPGAAQRLRVSGSHRNHLVGAPLAATIDRGRQSSSVAATWPVVVSIAGGFLLGVTGLVVGESLALVGGGGLAALGLAWFAVVQSKRHAAPTSSKELIGAAADLDAFLATITPRLPPEVLSRLGKLKSALAEASRVLSGTDQVPGTASEDSFFVHACISRYLPDACRHYLSVVEAARRANQKEEIESALAATCEQLDVLTRRLEDIFRRLAQREAEKLENHRKFIDSKG